MPRKPKSGVAAKQRSIRLTDKEWNELLKRGGADYIREILK